MPSRAETLLMRGHQARRERRLEDAARIFAEAVEAARLSKERPWLAQAYTELGRTERDLKETEDALLHYQEAATIYQQLDASLRYAHTVRHVADILREKGQLVAAGPRYREALQIYRTQTDTTPLDLANANRGFALLQGEIGENAQALELWREAGELYASVRVQAGVDESERQIARLSLVASPDHRQ